MLMLLAMVLASATSRPDADKPVKEAPAVRENAPVRQAAPPPRREAPAAPSAPRIAHPIRVVQPDPIIRVQPEPIVRSTPVASGPVRRPVPVEPRRPNPAPAPVTPQPTPTPQIIIVNSDDDHDRDRNGYYNQPYGYNYYNPYYTSNYFPVYYPVYIFSPLVPGFCNSYNSCYESYGTPGSTGYTSSEAQGFIMGQQGNTLILYTPDQQVLFVNASYLLQNGYPRYRFAPGTFVDIAGYYFQNQFVAIGVF